VSSRNKKRWHGRVYLGRNEDGKQLFHWVGRFDTRRERDDAVAEARLRLKRGGSIMLPTCDEYVDRYLAEYERVNKDSSTASQRQRLERFKRDFAGRSLDIPRSEAKDWIAGDGRWAFKGPVPASIVPAVVTLYNHAIDEDDLPLERNPFRKLGRRSRGRADKPPPTDEQFEALLEACAVHGEHYEPMMRGLIEFAAFTLMRPSELFALEWADVDFKTMRIHKLRRLYRGSVAEPKTGAKTIALTPPARDAIITLYRDRRLVFTSKTGRQLSAPTLTGYWHEVLARAGLDFDFYHATKHFGVHFLWAQLGLSRRAIAAQAGWSLRTVDKMLQVYGHGDVGALEEVDAAFRDKVIPLRGPREQRTETGTQT
jgi:integrase